MSAREPIVLLVVGGALLVWSGIAPADRTTWILEVFPIFIAVPLLIGTARRFPLTPLVYRLIFVHALILMLGGHYTYAQVPLGFWMQRVFGFSRNHYDRIGHLAQGFVPAVIAREILIRRSPLAPGKWLFFIVLSVCLAISACYEFIEWWSALIGGALPTRFSARRAIRSTPRRTCSWRSSARFWRRCYSLVCTTARSQKLQP